MELKQLYYFTTLCHCDSISSAARKLGITQQAISKSIVQLEEELNIRLFYRDTRHIQVSEAGKRLESLAEHILKEVDELPDVVKGLSEPLLYHWNIWAANDLQCGTRPLFDSGTLQSAASFFSNAEAALQQNANRICVEGLRNGSVDGGIVLSTMNYDEYRQINLKTVRLYAVLPRRHNLTKKLAVLPDEIADKILILPADDEDLRRQICSYFLEYGHKVPRKGQFRTLSDKKDGLGTRTDSDNEVLLISQEALGDHIESGLEAVPFYPALEIPVRFCYRYDHPCAELLEQFGQILKSRETAGEEKSE